jgi:predicted ATP-grasp superfamily ATP-dependent carboligase
MAACESPRYRILVMDGRIQSCLPVLKALRLKGHQVTIAESDPLCVGFYSRYPQERWRHRDPRKDPEGFLEDVRRSLSTGRFDILIPILDVTAELVSRHKAELERYVRIPLVDYPIFRRARDKSQTMNIAQSLGLPCPKTYFPDQADIVDIAREVAYPVLIKPNFSIGARGITKVDDPKELISRYLFIVGQYGPCSVQEYIPHAGRQYKAQIFLDRQQNVKSCIICKKIRYFPPTGGSGTLFVTVKRDDIQEIGIRLLKGMEWYAYGDIDFIADPRDGLVKIMEVNPRLSAPVKICFEAGVDIADVLVRFAMDREIPAVNDYQENVYLRHDGLDILWFLRSKERFQTDPNWFRFFGKNVKYQVMCADDPWPTFAYLAANIRDLFIQEARRYKFQRSSPGTSFS